MLEEAFDVAPELFAGLETAGDAFQDLQFGGGQRIGVVRIDGGEMGILQRIVFAAQVDGPFLEVDQVQHVAVFHAEFRVPVDHEFLLLELDDGDGLVHLGDQGQLRLGELFVFVFLGTEQCAGIVGVGFHREGRQGQEIDPIAVFQRG